MVLSRTAPVETENYMDDYKKIVEVYSETQLNKAHDIISDMLECAETAATQESNFGAEVAAIKTVQSILEKCINYGA